MQKDGLPLADVIDSDLFAQGFEGHDVDFGDDEDAVYTPAFTLWALVSQVFFAKEQRSCKAAVVRIASLWATMRPGLVSSDFQLAGRTKVALSSRCAAPEIDRA